MFEPPHVSGWPRHMALLLTVSGVNEQSHMSRLEGFRLVRSYLTLLAGVCALVGGMTEADAQGTTPAEAETTLVSSSWTVGCGPAADGDKDLLCEASQTIVVRKTGQTLLVAYVTPWRQAGVPNSFVLRFQLPHGLDIPAGVQVRIDGRPMASPVIQTSGNAGVFARTNLTSMLLSALKKGATMTVTFTALNGRKLSVPVTLDGFSAAFAKLK
jgi:invasion protein IalB